MGWCRVEYLSKFSPPPSSATASFGGALVERMAGRIVLFFMRHASLLRPLSHAGKLQLAKVRRPFHLRAICSRYPLCLPTVLAGPSSVLGVFWACIGTCVSRVSVLKEKTLYWHSKYSLTTLQDAAVSGHLVG